MASAATFNSNIHSDGILMLPRMHTTQQFKSLLTTHPLLPNSVVQSKVIPFRYIQV